MTISGGRHRDHRLAPHRITPRAALLVAATGVLVSLGIVWHATSATYGTLHPGFSSTTLTHNWYTGDLDLTPTYIPGTYIPGDPTDGARGFESPVRIVLAPAVVILLWTALRPTRTARRAAQFATYGLAVCALVAISDRYVVPALVSALAAGLTWWALRSPPTPASPPRPASPTTSF